MGGKTALKKAGVKAPAFCYSYPSYCSRKGEKGTIFCLLFLDLSSAWFLISLFVT